MYASRNPSSFTTFCHNFYYSREGDEQAEAMILDSKANFGLLCDASICIDKLDKVSRDFAISPRIISIEKYHSSNFVVLNIITNILPITICCVLLESSCLKIIAETREKNS